MSGCQEHKHAIGAYVLGALAPDEAAAVRGHLEACPACAAEYRELAPLPELLTAAAGAEAATAEPLPPAFEERLLDAYARDRAVTPRRSRRRPPRLRWLAAAGAAAAAVAAALVIALGGGGGEPAVPRYDVAFRPVGAVDTASGHGWLESDDAGTTLHLWVDDLPGGPDAVYEVLCDAEGWTATAGTFRTDADGKAYVILNTALRRGEYDAIRVVRRGHRADGSLVKRDLLAARLS